MAKKGRVARILTTLHRVAGTPVSEALKRRQRSAIQRGDAGTHSGTVSQWRKRRTDRDDANSSRAPRRRQACLTATTAERILLVGEGNLSFALALTTLFDGDGSNLLVTSFDRQRIARAAYPYCEDVEESLTNRARRWCSTWTWRNPTRSAGGETMVGRRGRRRRR